MNTNPKIQRSKDQLLSLLEHVEQCCIDDLSYNNVLNVWKSYGPVAAKVLSWIKPSRSVKRMRVEACSAKNDYQTFLLPVCGQELSISTTFLVDCNGNYITDIFKISCESLKIKNAQFVDVIIPSDNGMNQWNEFMIDRVVKPAMKPVIELLQKELGDTVPPITDKFFVWMCFRFPRLKEEHRIYFKDEAKNAMPSVESLQPILELYRKNKAQLIKKHIEQWLQNEKDVFHFANHIASALEFFAQKSQTAILRQLREDVERFSNVVSDYGLGKTPKKMMLDLVNRTTIFIGNLTAEAVANNHVNNKTQFRMKGGSVMKIDGGMHGDGASFLTWYELYMNFSLPDGSKVELPKTNFMDLSGSIEHKGFIKRLSLITEILQECIDESMKDEENIPKIGNIFTFYYFLQVMQFSKIKSFFQFYLLDPFESEESASDTDLSDFDSD
ncbi:uncharacterized protein LOC110253870 isoform X1 [Exaiptasia diaphana]|uniref:Uncharacterized protein n=1 Tax=Exaiptasia diaphana TaxID=2652724 RepID=A0A913YV85_EXADI|nr:uncharacterized protein LOC110253870 isoform X1 [Exaiptasia diaphana]